MININSRVLFYIIFCMLTGGTAHSSQPVAIGSPIFCYFTKNKVLIDSEQNPNEWVTCNRGSSIRYKIGKKTYDRHYVECMYDADWLYLSIETDYRPDFGKRISPYFLGSICSTNLNKKSFQAKEAKAPIDYFSLKVLSDNNTVINVSILSDGTAYSWPFSAIPSKSNVLDYVRGEYDISFAVISFNYANGSIEWHSEIKIPLKKLQPLGRKITFEISGAKCKMDFYPNKQSITRSFDEL